MSRRFAVAAAAAVVSTVAPARAGAQQVVTARLEPLVVLSEGVAVAVRGLGDDLGEVVVTTDGGESWLVTGRLADLGLAAPAGALCFGTRRVGVLVGEDGAVLRTADSGRTWRRHGTAPASGARRCQLVGGSRGYLVAGGRLLFSFDGGNRFRDVGPPSSTVRDSCFVDSLRGYAATDAGLHGTASGGRSWALLRSGPTTAVACGGSERVWVGTESGQVFASSDGGRSWSRGVDTALSGVEHLRFADDRLGLAAGSEGDAARTSDGGRSWQPMELPAEAVRPTFLSPGLAYCEGGGALHVSLDQGETWTTADPDWAPPPALSDLEEEPEPEETEGEGEEEGVRDVEPGEGDSVIIPLGLPGLIPR